MPACAFQRLLYLCRNCEGTHIWRLWCMDCRRPCFNCPGILHRWQRSGSCGELAGQISRISISRGVNRSHGVHVFKHVENKTVIVIQTYPQTKPQNYLKSAYTLDTTIAVDTSPAKSLTLVLIGKVETVAIQRKFHTFLTLCSFIRLAPKLLIVRHHGTRAKLTALVDWIHI